MGMIISENKQPTQLGQQYQVRKSESRQDATGNTVYIVTGQGGEALASVPVVVAPAYGADGVRVNWATSLGSCHLVG